MSVDGISISAALRVARWADLGSMRVIWEMNFSPEVGVTSLQGVPFLKRTFFAPEK